MNKQILMTKEENYLKYFYRINAINSIKAKINGKEIISSACYIYYYNEEDFIIYNLEKIWKDSNNEESFIDMFTRCSIHEFLHKVIKKESLFFVKIKKMNLFKLVVMKFNHKSRFYDEIHNKKAIIEHKIMEKLGV